MGAAVNASPHNFQAVLLMNPFLDIMGAMSNPTLHLTQHEWDEFGNPLDDIHARSSISKYCPLMNVRNQYYPPMLLIGAIDDENVPFHHSLKFGSKVRNQCKSSDSSSKRVLLNMEMDGGHHFHGKRLEVNTLKVSFSVRYYLKLKSDNPLPPK